MTTTGKDYWTNLRKGSRTSGRINKYLTLPAFNIICGRRNQSIEFVAGNPVAVVSAAGNAAYSMAAAFTVMFWIKNTYTAVEQVQSIFANRRTINADNQVQIWLYAQKLYVGLLKSASVETQVTSSIVPVGEWCHVAVTYDGTTMKMFINGVQDLSTLALAAPLDTSTGDLYSVVIGGDFNTDTYYIGFFDELLHYNYAMTAMQISSQMTTPRGAGDTGLVQYYPFNDTPIGAITGEYKDLVDINRHFPTDKREVLEHTDDYAPLKYGASFVTGQATVTLGVKSSLRFPVKRKPADNFALVVRWTDDNEIIQRRMLFNAPAPGIDTNPIFLAYTGEPLNSPYVLEIWNIDGNRTTTMAEALVLYSSVTTSPLTSVDRTSQLAQSANEPLVIDTSLFQAFPLSFPLTFNEEPTY